MSELTDLVERTPDIELLSPADGSRTDTIRGVFVVFGRKNRVTITDAFETWEPNPGNPTQDYKVKRFAELRDEEILDSLRLATRVGDELESELYKVFR